MQLTDGLSHQIGQIRPLDKQEACMQVGTEVLTMQIPVCMFKQGPSKLLASSEELDDSNMYRSSTIVEASALCFINIAGQHNNSHKVC